MASQQYVDELCKWMLADLSVFEPQAKVARCPFCLEPFVMNDPKSPKRPTAEHIIQGSLGGTLEHGVATCSRCNSGNWATLEAELKNAMDTLDFMEGNGTLPMTITNDVGHVAANLVWSKVGPTIKILGKKASNMKAVEAVPGMIHEDAKLRFILDYGFKGDSYRRAILRVGYLAAFRYSGYGYAFSEAAAITRTAMAVGSPPSGIILEAFPSVDLPMPFVAWEVETLKGILAMFRLRSRTTRWLAVLLPGETVVPWATLSQAVADPKRIGAQLSLPKLGMDVTITFDRDPIERLLEIRVPEPVA